MLKGPKTTFQMWKLVSSKWHNEDEEHFNYHVLELEKVGHNIGNRKESSLGQSFLCGILELCRDRDPRSEDSYLKNDSSDTVRIHLSLRGSLRHLRGSFSLRGSFCHRGSFRHWEDPFVIERILSSLRGSFCHWEGHFVIERIFSSLRKTFRRLRGSFCHGEDPFVIARILLSLRGSFRHLRGIRGSFCHSENRAVMDRILLVQRSFSVTERTLL